LFGQTALATIVPRKEDPELDILRSKRVEPFQQPDNVISDA
jgi:hypothetical protein